MVIEDFVNDVSKAHSQKVKEHEDKLKKAREDEDTRLATKHADKLRRKAEKIAQKKAEEIESLRQHVLANFVDKGAVVEGILAQELVEIDGWGKKDPNLGMLGGWLGQLMIVLNTVSKYFPETDRPSKSRAKSRASNNKSRGGDDSVSQGDNSRREERLVLNEPSVQGFIFNYVLEKLKVEKLTMQVAPEFEHYLINGLK